VANALVSLRAPLTMPEGLVTEPAVTQCLPFLSTAVVVTVAGTHYAYPLRDGQAELARAACLNTKVVYLRTAPCTGSGAARL